MFEPDDRLDERLRTAMRSLDDVTRRQVRTPGLDRVGTAGRRRRARAVAGAALALLLIGGLAVGGRLVRDATRPDNIAAPGCEPVEASVAIVVAPTDELRQLVAAILARSPEISSYRSIPKAESYERFRVQMRDAPELVAATKVDQMPEIWRFELRCASDYPAVRDRLSLPEFGVQCPCDPPPPPGKATVRGTRDGTAPADVTPTR